MELSVVLLRVMGLIWMVVVGRKIVTFSKLFAVVVGVMWRMYVMTGFRFSCMLFPVSLGGDGGEESELNVTVFKFGIVLQ